MKKIIPQWIKNIYHLKMAVLANIWYGFPSRKIKVIGVTGTNGKTTTAQMIAKILEDAGYKIGMASTINFKIGKDEWVNATKFTTLSAWEVQKFIRKVADSVCDYLVLETSSHSLDQYRVWGVNYKTAVITNVTREHLDYHKTMGKYRKAKLKLFQNCEIAVVNLDMENPEEFLQFDNKEKYLYTCHSERSRLAGESRNLSGSIDRLEMTQMIQAENIELGINGSKFKIQNSRFILNIPGQFNIENALAAACVGVSEGVNLENISASLQKIQGIPGRMESVPNEKGISIVIDYAVTPDSLEKLYDLISKAKKENSKIISVFGSCGERDRGKRPIMGEVVSKIADYMILTNEDPYGENPWQIINEVASGVKSKKEGESFWKIMDRREAINKALNMAKSGDIIVVTGKGAEETMAIGKERIPWNDKSVILEELASLGD